MSCHIGRVKAGLGSAHKATDQSPREAEKHAPGLMLEMPTLGSWLRCSIGSMPLVRPPPSVIGAWLLDEEVVAAGAVVLAAPGAVRNPLAAVVAPPSVMGDVVGVDPKGVKPPRVDPEDPAAAEEEELEAVDALPVDVALVPPEGMVPPLAPVGFTASSERPVPVRGASPAAAAAASGETPCPQPPISEQPVCALRLYPCVVPARDGRRA